MAAISIAASSERAVPYNISTKFEAHVTCHSQMGGTVAATTGVRFEVYQYYGSTTTTASSSAGATSISVASATGIVKGARLGIWDATNGGEILEVSNVSGTTLTVAATKYNHTNGANVYVIETTPTITVQPGPNSGNYAADKVYSKMIQFGTGLWFVRAVNLDASNAHTVELSAATIDAVS
jgi:hypothetical protein